MKLLFLYIFSLIFASNLLLAVEADKKESKIEIPTENMEKLTIPSMKPAEEAAKRILQAIIKDDPKSVHDLFFAAEAFDVLKDIRRPRQYHDKLVGWYVADIHREHKRVKDKKDLVFDGFQKGRCKWKAVGTEYNKIAYWSCYRSYFYAKSGKERIKFDLRAMINWGKSWRVTHLGPIPKN